MKKRTTNGKPSYNYGSMLSQGWGDNGYYLSMKRGQPSSRRSTSSDCQLPDLRSGPRVGGNVMEIGR